MAKRWIVAAAVAVVIALAVSVVVIRHHEPPDVILITIDTLRADALGFAGNRRVRTPYLDNLAARGIVFTNAHAHNVVTLPSHTNILTGLYPYQHGIRDNAGFTLDPSHPTLGRMLHDAGYATAAFVSAFPLDSRFGLNAGFDVYDDKYRETSNPLDFVVQERPAEETLNAARSWYESAAGRKRFLWIHLYDPHAPYDPPSPFREQYRDAPYLGEVAYVDAQLSRFLEPMLRSHPNTFVVVTGDHGEALGDHGEQTHGLFAYEATLKVPLVIVDIDQHPRRESAYVRHVDLVPTILKRAGARSPAGLPGRSLLSGPLGNDSYFESLSASLNRGWAPLVGMIHAGRKYIDLPIPELYDLAADPGEKQNLAQSDRRDLFAIRNLLAANAPPAKNITRSVDAAEKAQLMSLGYISGTVEKKTYTAADDPKNLIDVDNQLHEAVALYQTGQLPKAIDTLRAILKRDPDIKVAAQMLAFILGNPDRLNAYGIALAEGGDLPGARAQFERVLSIDPRNAKAYENLGVVALRAGDVTGARASLTKALALNDRLPVALNLMGVIEMKSNHPAEAIAYWQRATDADPKLYDAMYNLAIVAARTGKNDVARDALHRFIDTAPPQRYADDIATARALLAQLEK
ncbi:MAG TPA: sulfatase-like hydrolase/transferase [Thermoanaerobaculia bacterium]|jgi:arylsulfatase A-like enzyme